MKLHETTLVATVTAVSLMAAGTMAFAQSSTGTSSSTPADPAACSAALDTLNTAMGPAIDARATTEKHALAAKTTALKAALALTDETARKDAITAAEKAFMKSMKDGMQQSQDSVKAAMEALRTSCKGLLGFPGMRHGEMGMGMMRGPHHGFMKGMHDSKHDNNEDDNGGASSSVSNS